MSKIHLEVDEIRAVATQAARAAEPASQPAWRPMISMMVTMAGVIHVGVLPHLGAGGGDILGRGGKAGAVVGAVQVIVDGLWHADEADIAADSLGVAGQFADRIHGIISPDIEEIADAMLLKFLEKLWIYCVLQALRQLVPAGARYAPGVVRTISSSFVWSKAPMSIICP